MKVLEDRLGESDPSMASKLGNRLQQQLILTKFVHPKTNKKLFQIS